MRPLRLEIEGFTSFADPTVLDFSELELFAITGPTGAGKSSLIDAIIFALYGWVPRVGKEYRQLVSHGVSRLAVRLDFQIGRERYRVARSVRKSDGAVQARLDRIDGDAVESIAGKAREIEEEVERIIGLDHDAFTRSVVLPQGQFDLFLKGRPEERRKILVSLLNLRVYEDMHRLARARADTAARNAEFISKQIATDFADATEKHAAEARRAAKEAEKRRREAAARRKVLGEGLEAARAVRTARRDLEALEADATSTKTQVEKATGEATAAVEQRAVIEVQVDQLAQQIDAVQIDEQLLLRLTEALPRVERLVKSQPQLAALERQQVLTRQGLEQAQARHQGLAAEVGAAEAALAETERALGAAKAELERQQRQHAAAALRHGLKPGEPCPVCEQTVERVPPGHAPGLTQARTALTVLEAKLAGARDSVGKLQTSRARIEAEEQHARETIDTQHRRLAEERAELARERQALMEMGFPAAHVDDAARLLQPLRAEKQQLEKAKKSAAELRIRLQRLERERGDVDRRAAAARAVADDGAKRLRELEKRRDKAQTRFEQAREALRTLAEKHAWEGLRTQRDDGDEVDCVEALVATVDDELGTFSAAVARLGSELQALEARIARRAELEAELGGLKSTMALAGDLAANLRADRFLAYIQEEALRVLAEDGSRHLEQLSQGRYALACEKQDFFVVDHWNADEVRSVKTLSGGESFLASLALALALAERLCDFGVGRASAQPLESLFLDEGFGSLDRDTLDVVVQGIEALHGGRRMVGVVTHIPELAERMPVRVEVVRHHGKASLAIV